MKGILTILGVGVFSLLIGGGLGFVGGKAVFKPSATVTGACLPLETASKTGVLTAQQVRQLGANLAKTNPNLVAAANHTWVAYGEDESSCQQFLQALKAK